MTHKLLHTLRTNFIFTAKKTGKKEHSVINCGPDLNCRRLGFDKTSLKHSILLRCEIGLEVLSLLFILSFHQFDITLNLRLICVIKSMPLSTNLAPLAV